MSPVGTQNDKRRGTRLVGEDGGWRKERVVLTFAPLRNVLFAFKRAPRFLLVIPPLLPFLCARIHTQIRAHFYITEQLVEKRRTCGWRLRGIERRRILLARNYPTTLVFGLHDSFTSAKFSTVPIPQEGK